MRTCVGCRAAGPSTDRVRVARDLQGVLVLDRDGPGRGAWLCTGTVPGVPAEACFEQAVLRQGFGRAFRVPVTAPAIDVLRRTMQERARIERGTAAGGAARRD